MTGPVTCRFCPAVLHRVAIPELDEWGWAGPDGHRYGDDPDLAHCGPNPWAYLNELAPAASPARARGPCPAMPLQVSTRC